MQLVQRVFGNFLEFLSKIVGFLKESIEFSVKIKVHHRKKPQKFGQRTYKDHVAED